MREEHPSRFIFPFHSPNIDPLRFNLYNVKRNTISYFAFRDWRRSGPYHCDHRRPLRFRRRSFLSRLMSYLDGQEREATMKIRISTQACGDRLDCRICMEVCPEKVFGVRPRRRKDPPVPARDWIIYPVVPHRCTGCQKCETLCPQGAITVL